MDTWLMIVSPTPGILTYCTVYVNVNKYWVCLRKVSYLKHELVKKITSE